MTWGERAKWLQEQADEQHRSQEQMMSTDKPQWIHTFSGVAFTFPPEASNFRFTDIAHALSMLCRYGGHTRRFYSVAEHATAMAQYIMRETNNYDAARWALFHDATEAYVGDVIRPIKRHLPEYEKIEAQVEAELRKWLRTPKDHLVNATVKALDLRICKDERDALFSDPPMVWWDIDDLEPLGVDIVGYTPDIARERFRHTAFTLFPEMVDSWVSEEYL